MGFSVRKLNEFDYDVLCKWWKDWRWTPPVKEFLPENGIGGIMVSHHGYDIFAGFIYFTNSAVCWSEFIISDFYFKDKDLRSEALNILITELNEIAMSRGYKFMYTVVKNKNLETAYKASGFVNGSLQVNEMFKIL